MSKLIAAVLMLVALTAASPLAAQTNVYVTVAPPWPGPNAGVPYMPYGYYPPPGVWYPGGWPWYYDDGSWRLGRGFGWGYRHFEGRGDAIQGYTLPGRN